MIKKRPSAAAKMNRQTINASTSITSNVRNRNNKSAVMASRMASLTPSQQTFVRQLQANGRRHAAIMGATNTSNIAAKPEFLELLPLFVQKLYILDVFGSVAMKSRQQIIPYFKFVAENTKGDTEKGTVLSSPMVNRQGIDPNFTGRTVKNELMGEKAIPSALTAAIVYTPVLPGSVTFQAAVSGVTTAFTDDANGNILDSKGGAQGTINYATGVVDFSSATDGVLTATVDTLKVTYQYDNETVGPDENGQYGAKMAKGYLDLDEINLKAEAHEIACYWSVYSAFAAQTEYGANIADMAKEAAFSELTAEINTAGFQLLLRNAQYKPQYNWDASPVIAGAVVPSDYLNMFKLTLSNAAASIYQRTRLSQPNRIVCGTLVGSYMSMIDGFQADNSEDRVGPYRLGKLDAFEIYVDPSYDPSVWVMCCKNADIRRNSALFGEYMPITSTDAIGLANMSVQQGWATMYGMNVVNPDTIVSGRIIGGIA